MKHSVLVVDDEVAVAKVLAAQLSQASMDVTVAHSAGAALKVLEERYVELVLSDVRMPGASGMELADLIYERWPDVAVVMITAHGSIELAVEAMKRGASDFLTKPFEREHVVATVRRALALSASHEGGRTIRSRTHESAGHIPSLVGQSPAMQSVRGLISRFAGHDSPVLISGPSGSGKELVARSLHAQSVRAEAPFIAINCAALPAHLVESELFGHRKGAFTGATRDYLGRFGLADGGTLFLDEVAELPLAVQPKLLRALAEGMVVPVGAEQERPVDVRILSATHRDLREMVEQGDFREDLYYRLVVLEIEVPALSARKEDVASLVRHFCQQQGSVRFSDEALHDLASRNWPGNVRELQNVVERLRILSDGPEVRKEDVANVLGVSAATKGPRQRGEDLRESRAEAEKEAILEALQRTGGNRSQAARLLGVSRRTLYNKLEAFEIVG